MLIHQPKIRVVLVDELELIRSGLAHLVDEIPGVRVVGQASTSEAGLAALVEASPDVALLDYGLADVDAPKLLRRMREVCPQIPALVLSLRASIYYAMRALRAGAKGYLAMDSPTLEFTHAIMQVARGGSYVPPELRGELRRRLEAPGRRREGLDGLSEREFELLRYLSHGLTLQQCSIAMGVTDSTVSTFRRRLLDKLDAESNAQLVRIAIQSGLDDTCST